MPKLARCVWAMFFMYCPTVLLEYVTRRGVLPRRCGQNVGPFQGVDAGAADIAQRIVGANRRPIHAGEDIQGLGALILPFDVG